jgi:hypothetical protein
MTRRAFDTRRHCSQDLFLCPETSYSYVLEHHTFGRTIYQWKRFKS